MKLVFSVTERKVNNRLAAVFYRFMLDKLTDEECKGKELERDVLANRLQDAATFLQTQNDVNNIMK